MKSKKVRITFIEEILGTCAANPELHSEYIASKAPDAMTREQEIAAIGVETATEKAMTVFPRNPEGKKILWGYQVKGYIKAAQKTLNMVSEKGKFPYLAAYKTKIDNLVFVKSVTQSWDERDKGIVIHCPKGVPSPDCERPLRAETAQGPRVALAHSETCPEGSYIDIEIMVRDDSLEKHIDKWLESGIFYGMGQWRNAGKGRFKYEYI